MVWAVALDVEWLFGESWSCMQSFQVISAEITMLHELISIMMLIIRLSKKQYHAHNRLANKED